MKSIPFFSFLILSYCEFPKLLIDYQVLKAANRTPVGINNFASIAQWQSLRLPPGRRRILTVYSLKISDVA
jgi:hypothetical protein